MFGGGCWRSSSDCEGGRLTSAAQVAEEIERPCYRSARAPNLNGDAMKHLILCVCVCVCVEKENIQLFCCCLFVERCFLSGAFIKHCACNGGLIRGERWGFVSMKKKIVATSFRRKKRHRFTAQV